MFDTLSAGLQARENLPALLLTLAAFVLLLLLSQLALALRMRRANRRITALTRGMDGQNLEAALTSHFDMGVQTNRRMDALEQAVGVLQAQMPLALQKARLIRYDAFEDVGGEQSFSLALLNARGDGVVLTSVYSRMDVRVYAKAIAGGQASHALSREEERALRECIAG